MNSSPIITATVAGKSVRLEDLPEDAFRIVVGRQGTSADRELYTKVWALYRGVHMRAGKVGSMPFEIRNKAGDVVTSSDSYEDVTKMLPRPRRTFERAEAALTIFGTCYFEKGKNIAKRPRDLFYLLPTSVKPEFSEKGDLTGFKRSVKRGERLVEIPFKPDELVYLWGEDPWVELGPPASSPFMAAMAAAGVLLSVDRFATLFFERGAIKATLLAVDGNPPEAEKERIKSMWRRLMTGIKNAWSDMVINAKALNPVVVGEGLESLAQSELTEEKAQAIATALGIPYSMLFSDAANYATAETDKATFYENLIIPECEFIAEELNEQYFAPAGYKLVFTPESLDIFQEDEEQRSASLLQWVNAIERDPETALIGMDLLGFELSDEIRERIEALGAEKKAERERMATQLQPGETQPNNVPPGQPGEPEPDPVKSDLAKWERKALKRVKDGKEAWCNFESSVLPDDTVRAIRAGLEEAETVDDVKAVFAGHLDTVAPANPMDRLAAELKRANDLLEQSMEEGA